MGAAILLRMFHDVSTQQGCGFPRRSNSFCTSLNYLKALEFTKQRSVNSRTSNVSSSLCIVKINSCYFYSQEEDDVHKILFIIVLTVCSKTNC